MSATFKNSKKKLSQSELRKFMNEHKVKQKEVKKIESPLAKYPFIFLIYNQKLQWSTILVSEPLGLVQGLEILSRSPEKAVWTVHINAKQHKQNVELAKKLKERTNNFTTLLKRPLTPPLPDIPEKKVKGILKNSTKTVLEDSNNSSKTNNNLPEDFFDSKSKHKARNQEYKDPVEEEWEKFVKAIKEADNESNAIIAEDQEEATAERQIDEIDEQMKKLSRYAKNMLSGSTCTN
ncbi:hypothetical protein NQ314_011530 [Rhamnusium bicolor]|uniref:ZNF380 coiled-coil domain-containing protein n=1 Tax=Rhamnusium bicolor TaxID=1586634 RepID=A0AAV8XIL7_9CUCU|nr:hypothetical protein NQ314_011530 [Rhamnusium bicolor]